MPRLLALLVLAAACSVKPLSTAPGTDAGSGMAMPLADGSPLSPEVAPPDLAAEAPVPDAPPAPDAAADLVVASDLAPDLLAIEPDAAPPSPDVASDLAADLAPTSDLSLDSGPEASAPAPGRELVFITNQDSNDISVFDVNTETGARTLVPGSPFAAGQRPWDLVITPDGKFLYVCHYGDEDVRGFRVAADGRLTAMAGATAPLPTPQILVMAPNGRAIYAAGTDGLLRGLTVDPASGALAPITGSPFAGLTGVQGLAMEPLGRFLAVVARVNPSGAGVLHLFAITPGTGALQPAAQVAISGSIHGDAPALAFDPSGAFIYGASSGTGGSDQIFGFRVSYPTGALTPIPGGPWPGCGEAHSMSFHPTRPLVYYGCTGELLVLRTSAAGALNAEPGSPVYFNNDTDTAVSTGGNFLYVNFQTDHEVTVSRIGASGLPEVFSGSPWKTGTNPWRIVVWTAPSF